MLSVNFITGLSVALIASIFLGPFVWKVRIYRNIIFPFIVGFCFFFFLVSLLLSSSIIGNVDSESQYYWPVLILTKLFVLSLLLFPVICIVFAVKNLVAMIRGKPGKDIKDVKYI